MNGDDTLLYLINVMKMMCENDVNILCSKLILKSTTLILFISVINMTLIRGNGNVMLMTFFFF